MRVLLVVLWMFVAGVVQAASPVPAELEGWQDWVLKGEGFRRCPLMSGTRGATSADYICIWPGLLTIDTDEHGARLAQTWHVDVDGWVPLPGDREHWPQQVLVNGRVAPVVDRGFPALWLTQGVHRVEAQLHWAQRPQTLRIPEITTLLALSMDGSVVPAAQRQGGQLTLGRPRDADNVADSIDLSVFRKFSDGIPAMLTTQIRIFASGQPREEVFGPSLPEGFVPLALASEEWPARLDEHGLLHVQVQPGYNELTLEARAANTMDAIVARLPQAWASQEIWSYEAAPALRTTQASAAVQVDPDQAGVPQEWIKLPAWAMSDGDTLTIEQRSRGASADVENSLILRRDARLDFSGDGWSMADTIFGQMHSGWRFDALAPFSLQRAFGADGPMLVTDGTESGSRGFEWRTASVDLNAGLRMDRRSTAMPVSGWQQVFEHVTTRLHLPYGYRLIAAPGTDRGNGSWLSSWTLLDVFAAAILILLTGRMLGRIGAGVALLYLLLGYHEAGSPLWTILLVLALALVVRALPPGRLAAFLGRVRWALMVLLIVLAVPFAVGQLRAALYPQLEDVAWVEDAVSQWTDRMAESSPHTAVQQEASMPMPPAPPSPPPKVRGDEGGLDSIVVTGSRIRARDLISQYSETTVVQTGAGEPRWDLGNRYTLRWSGPVLPSQQVRLVIAPPWLVRTLRVVLVGMLGWLIWGLLRGSPTPRRKAPVASSVALLGLCALLVSPMAGARDYPPESLLEQLRERLVEAPECAPACASFARAQVIADQDDIRVVLEAHAAAPIALPLPVGDDGLVLRELRLDGRVQEALSRRDGTPWLAVERGVHRIELTYSVHDGHVALVFALPPHRVAVDGEQWQTGGLEDGRLLTETLTLTRLSEPADGPPLSSRQQFAPYVQVTRVLHLNLEWEVLTTVERLAPREGGFTLPVPTVPGEHVISTGQQVHDGQVTVAMGGDDTQFNWFSSLQHADTIQWTAPPLGERAEVWRVLVSPIWHVEFSGVPESGRLAGDTAYDPADLHEFVFHPLPGETLTVAVSRPAAADGDARAIDKLSLRSEFGKRASTHTLAFDMRASQGGEQTIHVPAQSQLLGVVRNGQHIGARVLDGQLSLPVNPGSQSYEVHLRDHAGQGAVVRTPEILMGLPAANIDLSIKLPADRWLLAATGPAVGPAVMFWGELVVMVVLAWLLSRWGRSGLRLRHWLLLVLGFSTYSWFALAVVVAWLLALEWRQHHVPRGKWRFDLMQVGLLVLTAAALGYLFAGIRVGLLGSPDMMVSGNGSSASDLRWFADMSADALPSARVISLPLWIYNVIMLAWALWLASATVGWLRRGFTAWTTGGYWRPLRKPRAAPAEEA